MSLEKKAITAQSKEIWVARAGSTERFNITTNKRELKVHIEKESTKWWHQTMFFINIWSWLFHRNDIIFSYHICSLDTDMKKDNLWEDFWHRLLTTIHLSTQSHGI